MNSKFLMYMMTGNMMFLFLPVKTALLMSMMGMNFGGSSNTANPYAIQTTTGTGTSSLSGMLPLLALSGGLGGGRRRSRRKVIVVHRRGRRYY